ncbi:MAG: dehydrogenase [Gammaproteobacteria bacterium]|jgi:glycolate oxidase FAD binding subunit
MKSIAEFQQFIKESEKIHIGGTRSELIENIDMSIYSGVVEYHPEELVITLKSGTSIAEIEQILKKHNQALTFYTDNPGQTIGALYASAGPDFADAILGVQIINGKGQLMNFGGQVMKNVAGYDVSRLLVGSKGQLALITQMSFKILPTEAALKNQKKPKPQQSTSALHMSLTKKLKQIFDPYGVFV